MYNFYLLWWEWKVLIKGCTYAWVRLFMIGKYSRGLENKKERTLHFSNLRAMYVHLLEIFINMHIHEKFLRRPRSKILYRAQRLSPKLQFPNQLSVETLDLIILYQPKPIKNSSGSMINLHFFNM